MPLPCSDKTDTGTARLPAENRRCYEETGDKGSSFSDSTPEQDEREADMLYAEFAMDFATLAMQQALISALTALDRQGEAEDTGVPEEQNKEETGCKK